MAIPRRTVFRPVVLLHILIVVLGMGVSAEETLFRLDGQLGKDGRALASVPVGEGQQLVFKVASLDFPARLRISINGQELLAEPAGPVLTSRYLHVRKAGVAQVIVESLVPNPPAGSFQLRVLRQKDGIVLTRSGVQKGIITQLDQRDGRNRFIDWYPLPVVKGQHLLVGVSSRTADAALKVEMPDGANLENDDAIGSDARLQLEVAETGTAWIGASVILRDEQMREDMSIPYQVYVRDYQPQVKSLVLGQAPPLTPFIPVAEDLSPLPEQFTFTALKAGVYRFRMDGRDGAIPVLRGTTDAGRLLGYTAERNARDYAQIRCYLRQNQRLDLVAESLPGGTRQHFSLGVQYESAGVVLRDGDNVERELQDPRQGFYVYRGRAGEYVEVLMTSDDFETRLLASDPLGQSFSWSKYYGSDFSYASLGGYWFDQAGDLLLETSGKNAGDDGLYQISVRSSLSGGLVLPREPAPRSLLGSGVPVYFRLTDRSQALPDGFGCEFQMDLKAQDLVSLRLQSWDVAARLQVFGPDGLELANGGGQPVKDNTLELVAARPGRYLVRCSVPVDAGRPLNATASLVYDIVGSALPLDADLVNRTCELVPQADRPGSETAMYDLPLRLRSAQHLYVTVVSTDFLPVLKLLDKDGIVVEENHGRGAGEASRIDFVIQKGGNYRLRILSAGAVETVVPAGTSPAGTSQPNPRCQVSVYEIR